MVTNFKKSVSIWISCRQEHSGNFFDSLVFRATVYKSNFVDWLKWQQRQSKKHRRRITQQICWCLSHNAECWTKTWTQLRRKQELCLACNHNNVSYNITHRTTGQPAGPRRLTLQIRQLLLRDILARDHVLNNAVHCIEYHLVVTQRQHRVYLSVQQAMSVNRYDTATSIICTVHIASNKGSLAQQWPSSIKAILYSK